METPFRVMDFVADRPVTRDDMDQMQSNLQWLYDNTPRGRFVRINGTIKETKIIILGGMNFIPKNPNQDGAYSYVRLGSAFAPNCQPIVTTGVVANFSKKIHCAVTGPGGTNFPNSSGFDIRVKVAAVDPKNDNIGDNMYVHWSAMGFRQDNINEF